MAQHETRSYSRTSTRSSPTGSGLPKRNRAELLEGARAPLLIVVAVQSCSTSWSAVSRPHPAKDYEKPQCWQAPPAAPRRAPSVHVSAAQKYAEQSKRRLLWTRILTVADKNEALMTKLLARMEAIDHRLNRLEKR
ncbi:hypothetical protein BST61_g2307 [Cercospora zeina]